MNEAPFVRFIPKGDHRKVPDNEADSGHSDLRTSFTSTSAN